MTSTTAPAAAARRSPAVTATRALLALIGAFLAFASIMFGFVGAAGEDPDPLATAVILPVAAAFLLGAAQLERRWALVAVLTVLWTGFSIGKVLMGETESTPLLVLGALTAALAWSARVREACGVRL